MGALLDLSIRNMAFIFLFTAVPVDLAPFRLLLTKHGIFQKVWVSLFLILLQPHHLKHLRWFHWQVGYRLYLFVVHLKQLLIIVNTISGDVYQEIMDLTPLASRSVQEDLRVLN